jgi:hypothetical protein
MSEALMRTARHLARRAKGIGDWPLWTLSRWLTAYVIAVVTAALAAIGFTALTTGFSERNLGLFGLLLGCTVAAVEMTTRVSHFCDWGG